MPRSRADSGRHRGLRRSLRLQGQRSRIHILIISAIWLIGHDNPILTHFPEARNPFSLVFLAAPLCPEVRSRGLPRVHSTQQPRERILSMLRSQPAPPPATRHPLTMIDPTHIPDTDDPQASLGKFHLEELSSRGGSIISAPAEAIANLAFRGLRAASSNGHLACAALLSPLCSPAKNSAALIAASRAGHVECVGLLAPRANASFAYLSIALESSAQCGHRECVEILWPLTRQLPGHPPLRLLPPTPAFADFMRQPP